MDIKPDLADDLYGSAYIKKKCKNDIYAQHLYAGLCNNIFIKDDKEWSCSWRSAGAIIADIRRCGEQYIDWYCSGITNRKDLMREGCVSDQVRQDIYNLGWKIKPFDCEESLIENI